MSRFILGCTCLFFIAGTLGAADEDTPRAAKTRKVLKLKLEEEIDFEDLRLQECVNELKDYIKDVDKKAILNVIFDSKNGVSRNSKLTYKAPEGKTVEEVLDGMLKKLELGYIVISHKGNAYDGSVQIRKSDERGYPKKK